MKLEVDEYLERLGREDFLKIYAKLYCPHDFGLEVECNFNCSKHDDSMLVCWNKALTNK